MPTSRPAPMKSSVAPNDLELIVANIPGLVYASSPNGELEFVNRQVLEYFGRTLAELKQLPMSDTIHPDDVPGVLAARKHAMETGAPYEIDAHRVRRADGVYRWFTGRVRPVRDAEGHVEHWYSLLTDIEDRKHAEEMLRASEDHFRRVVNGIPGFVFSAAADGQIEFVNQRLVEYTGRTVEELKQWTATDLVHPDDLPRVLDELRRSIETGQSQSVEHRVRGADGEYRWFDVRRLPERDTDGRIVRQYLVLFDIHDLKTTTGELQQALDEIKLLENRLYRENLALRDEVDRTAMFEEIVGASTALKTVLLRIAKVAPTDSTVFITGETGTGKELIARALHKRSRRSGRALVRVDCAALPPTLISSELFGHEKGAFTGAVQRRLGRFELADGGTIFLEEVGELPADTQTALLRVLQEGEFERVGGTQPIRVDVRVIAATNRDLSAAAANGSFRRDLFYRLNVFPIEVPPLRERKDDISMLVEYFVQRYASRTGRHFRSIDKKTLDLLLAYEWPGNIRELQNVIDRSVILSTGEVFAVDKSWLLTESRPSAAVVPAVPVPGDPRSEREIIEAALAESRGRVSGPSGAAAKLGIPPSTLDHRIKALRIDKKQFKFRLTPASESPESPPESPE